MRGARSESYHEVTLGELELVRETLLLGVPGGALDLVVVVVQSDDVDARELDNLSRRSTNTAANVQDAHVVLEVHLVCEVVLVASNGLVEGLAVGITAEVEALAPTVLVQVSREVVVMPGEGGVFVSPLLLGVRMFVACESIWSAHLASLLSLVGSGLVVPMLEVLVYRGLLGSLVLLQHGSHTATGARRLAVHCLVELGIASVIFLFKCGGRHVECDVEAVAVQRVTTGEEKNGNW